MRRGMPDRLSLSIDFTEEEEDALVDMLFQIYAECSLHPEHVSFATDMLRELGEIE
jgi:hypothetical protein